MHTPAARIGEEQIIEVPTPVGPVWFRGRDTGRDLLLIITGTFAEIDVLEGVQEAFPNIDVLRAHLPGNHSPAFSVDSVAGFAEGFSTALSARFAGRRAVALGLSVGALVALSLRTSVVKRLILVEPILTTAGVWPLEFYRGQTPAGAEDFVWNILGVGAQTIEVRDYTSALTALEIPAIALVGTDPLVPRRHFKTMPSLVCDAALMQLKAHPHVEVWEVEGAGHNLPAQNISVFIRAMRQSIAAL